MKSSRKEHLWLAIFVTLTAAALGFRDKCNGISRGRKFTIGFTDNIDAHVESKQLFILVVAFSNRNTDVTISSMHEVEGERLQQTFQIEARGFQRINIPVEYMLDNTERSSKGIRVSASSEVSVYGLSYQDYTTDGFLGIPNSNLGKQYVVVTPRDPRIRLPTHFAVIGTQDSTLVHVTLRTTVPITFEGNTYNQGDVISFMLDDLESVQIQSPDSGTLTGSIIQSNQPVAVFSGNLCVNTPGSACDTLTEQLVPITTWGQRHVYTAFDDSDSNIYFVVAYFNNTVVEIPGLANQTLNPGEFWEGSLSGSGLVSSSKPSLMMQLLATIDGNTVDPSLIQIPSEEQFDYEFGFTTPPHSAGDSQGYFNFINIVVKRGSQESVRLNGSPTDLLDSQIYDIPNTDYIVIAIRLGKGEAVYFVEQTDLSSSPMSIIVYGYESFETYGYAAGLSLPKNEQLLSFSPFYFREIGGEKLTVTVPCVQRDTSLENPDSKCKFSTGIGEVQMLGRRVDTYTVDCETPFFYQSGLTQVYVSLDNGTSFPYSGNIYVASQEDFPPLLSVEQVNWEERGRVIGFQGNDPIELSWDHEVVSEGVSHVDVMMQNFDLDSNGVAVKRDEKLVIRSDVNNGGNVTILPTEIQTSLEIAATSTSTSKQSPLVVFSIHPTDLRRRRNPLTPIDAILGGVLAVSYVGNCDTYDGVLSDRAQNVPPCPCQDTQASGDSNFQLSNDLISFYHPGAANCFRSTTSTASGSGQQCCYGSDGNILVGPPGGGTVDRYSPVDNFLGHQTHDVLPWLACCKFSNNCDKYYRHRPSDDCSLYEPPRPARGFGDPHITTIDGKLFTFNGAGEFLLIYSILHNLTFQARMEVYRDTKASVYSAFVIQTNDSSKVQVERTTTNKTAVYIDGEPLRLASIPIRVLNYNGVQIRSTRDQSEIKIVLKAGIALTIYTHADVMSFIAQLDEKFQGQIKGLLGNLNEDPEDDFQFPNGTIINGTVDLQEIHEYGMTWLDSIFTYSSPNDYNTYYFPDFTPTFDITSPDEVSPEIKKLCGDSFECIFDAVTTGGLSFANETLVMSATFDRIKRSSIKIISCGFPGVVKHGRVSGHVYLVNSTLDVTCDDGYALKGSSSLTCDEIGNWSSPLARCAATDRMKRKKWRKGGYSKLKREKERKNEYKQNERVKDL